MSYSPNSFGSFCPTGRGRTSRVAAVVRRTEEEVLVRFIDDISRKHETAEAGTSENETIGKAELDETLAESGAKGSDESGK